MTMLLTACGSNAGFSDSTLNPPAPTVVGTPPAPYGKQIFHTPIIGTDLDISTFDPALVTDEDSYQAVSMVFNGLIRFDDNLQIRPELAQSWEQSSDGLQWTFHLRPNLLFSDGTPLTSKDVAYSIDRSLQPATKSDVGLYYLGLIQDADKLSAGKIKTIIGDSILTPDANTVVLRTSKKTAYFLYTLTYPTAYVVNERLVVRYGNAKFTDHLQEGAGSGPFKVSAYLHGKEIDFVPNSYYYGLKPLLQEVVIPFIKTSAQAYQSYQNGELDLTYPPLDRIDEAKQSKEYSDPPQLSIWYIGMNFLAKPFDDLRIRQAFALSIQRNRLRYDVFKDTIIPTYHIIPQGMIGYQLGLTGPFGIKDTEGNADVARRLFQQGLREEGWTDNSQMPPIKLTYEKGAGADKIITMLLQMWQNVLNVNIIPNPVDFNTLNTEQEATKHNSKGLQMWFSGWIADYPDPQDWTTLQFDKDAVGNYMNYGQNTTADALQEQIVQGQLEQADAETNPTYRLQLYQTAEQQLVNVVAWLPLYQDTQPTLMKSYVQGLVFNALGIIPPTDWANIYIAQH
jgi:peptide/nickel transport system substrate-binding protein/oligopeptide transport system substrate-binding protein